MNIALGIVGIFASFGLMVFLTMKNFSTLYVTIIVSIVVMITNGLPITSTLVSVYMPGVASFVGSFYAIMVAGAIMGKIYDKSGAATSISRWLVRNMLRGSDQMSDDKRTALTVLVIMIAGMLLTFGGINNVVLLLTMYPLAVGACKEANIPQRFAIGIACCGTNTFADVAPFSPQTPNLAAMTALGTPSNAAMIPGIVGALVEMVTIIWVFTIVVRKARARGEVFSYGPNDTAFTENADLPNPILSLLPLLFIFVSFNFLKLHISLAVAGGVIISLILFWKQLKLQGVLDVVNSGAETSTTALLLISSVVGFGSVVAATESYQILIGTLMGMSIHPYLQLMICMFVFALVAGSPTATLKMALPTLGPAFISQGYAAGAIHRISAFASTVTDSLPCSGGVVLGVALSGRTMKEAYPGIFISTSLAALTGTVAVALVSFLFPALAV